MWMMALAFLHLQFSQQQPFLKYFEKEFFGERQYNHAS
jgi:hypothetical protein